MGLKRDFDDPEGATPIDDLSGLKIKEISSRQELFALEFDTCADASVRYLTGEKKIKNWSLDELYQIHEAMFGAVWEWAGKKRKTELNLGVRPFEIDSQMAEVLKNIQLWEKEKLDPLEIAVRLQYKLVWIHPFLNGNGRWARLAANIYLYQKTKKLFHWPEETMGKNSNFRVRYLEALKAADQLNYDPLIQLHQAVIA